MSDQIVSLKVVRDRVVIKFPGHDMRVFSRMLKQLHLPAFPTTFLLKDLDAQIEHNETIIAGLQAFSSGARLAGDVTTINNALKEIQASRSQ